MSKFSNLLRLLILLKSRKRVKTKELADALGVSERMIRKYMNDLAEANVNVESIPGPTGGVELIGYDYLLNLDIKSNEFVFKAKHKIETSKEYQNKYGGIGPKEEYINNMHKYRDALVHKNNKTGAANIFTDVR